MSLSIGVNLRVTGHCNQGGRRYMEDMFRVAYQRSSDGKDLECAFFGIFDGHGGGEAALFAKEHLMDIIIKQKNFWSDKDEDVLRAIRDGYVNTHYAMWRELDKWPRTASGLPSTAGTTASVAFIRKGKIYIGHVGDSGIVLGYEEKGCPQWRAKPLTRDHKPESDPEITRIQESGGKVVNKSGVPRVVWNRPRIGHKGPVRRSTPIDEIPFLAVARSLGDLWSYNSEQDTFVVSPEPDVKVVSIDVSTHRCLIFGTDGLWNMLNPLAAVTIVQAAETHNEKHLIASQQTGNGQSDAEMWINPSKSLVDRALYRWSMTRLRADNTSVVTLMLDPPTPTRAETMISQKKDLLNPTKPPETSTEIPENTSDTENNDVSEDLSTRSTSPIREFDFSIVKEPDSSDAPECEPSSATVTPPISDDDESIQVAEVSSSEDKSFVEPSEPERTVESSNEVEMDDTVVVSTEQEQEPEKEEDNFVARRLRRSEPKDDPSKTKRKRESIEKRLYGLSGATATRRANRVAAKGQDNSAQEVAERTNSRRETRSLPSKNVKAQCSKRNEEKQEIVRRRTRSEAHSEAADENDPTRQKFSQTCKRLKWSSSDNGPEPASATKSSADRKLPSPSPFQRRNLEKKVTPTKTVRRVSLNEPSRLLRLNVNQQNRGNGQRANHRVVMGANYDVLSNTEAQRWLRSDTIAATSMRTLRSRNVDITGHTIPAQMAPRYDYVKSRASLPAKIRSIATPPAKACATPGASTSKGKQVSATPSAAVSSAPMIKRTRSRFKRLGK